jgi:hypothetical protein
MVYLVSFVLVESLKKGLQVESYALPYRTWIVLAMLDIYLEKPMKLNVSHRFGCNPETFWNMYWDDSFEEVLNQSTDVKRELLEEKDDGEIYYRKLKFTPEKDLPRPAAKVLGSSKLIYEQENTFYRSKSEMVWGVLPSLLPGRLSAGGLMKVLPDGDGCRLEVTGDIEVKVRFVGGQIEKMVVGQVETSYDKLAQAARLWLAERDLA